MYICVAEPKEQFDSLGRSLGKGERRALYYDNRLHRKRVYRSSYPIPEFKSFRLYQYKTKSIAEMLCRNINEAYNDDFEVVEVYEKEG